MTLFRLEDTAFLVGRQQPRDPWNCKALHFSLEDDYCDLSEPDRSKTELGTEAGAHGNQELQDESVASLQLPMMKSPFEEVACQDRGANSPSRLPLWHEASPYRLPRKPLAELQTCRGSHDDSDSIRMDDLQSTVRLLSMSFGN